MSVFVPMESEWWPQIRLGLAQPWPDAAAFMDLRWHAARGAESGVFPSAAELGERWGWSRWEVCKAIGRADLWADPATGHQWHRRQPMSEAEVDLDAEFEHPGPLTHADVVDRAVRWLRGHHNCSVVFAEINTYEKVNPDAIGFRKLAGASRGWSVLVEAKISRGDFRADREKIIHRLPDSCPGQERWYLTPPGLVRADETPAGWGLAEVGKRSVRIVLPAPVGEPNMERHHADLGILLSALRRHQVGAGWRHEIAKFVPYDERMGAK